MKLDHTARKSSSQTHQQLVVKNGKKLSEEADSYVVQSGDSLYTLSKRFGLSIEEIKKRNGLHTSSLRVGQILFLQKSERRWRKR